MSAPRSIDPLGHGPLEPESLHPLICAACGCAFESDRLDREFCASCEDPTPYCSACGAKHKRYCTCGPLDPMD